VTGARRVLVSGHVQGVAFRWSTRARARELGVTGWVRNLADGRVEAHVEGEATALAEMLRWLGQGPAAAHVDALDVSDAPAEGGAEFAVLR
jgi:acylphosphatase